MNFTKEQGAIVEAEAPIVVVRAFAGTGKTTALLGFAKRRWQTRMLYIVLNKSVQIEAQQKFKGTGVKPITSHGLAFKHTGVQYKNKLVNNLKPYEVEKALGLSNTLSREMGYRSNYNDDMVIASVVLDTLIRYLYSTDKEIQTKHILNIKRLDKILGDLDENKVKQVVLLQAKRLWEKMTNVQDNSVGMIHDGYLKLFQLSDPVLSGYEYILIDEAQDMNPVTMAIIFKQTAKKVFVGDSHQAIYGWRGARNALGFATRQGGVNLYLTGSFRFGPNIATIANMILATKGETVRVQGLGGEDRVGYIYEGDQRTVISRSNAGVFLHTARAINNEKTWWHIGGSEGYRFDQILDIYYLWKRLFNSIRDPFIRTFSNFLELKSYAEEVEDAEVRPRCRIVEEYGDRIPGIIDKINGKVSAAFDLESADVVLGTAHKSKGLEFTNIQLDDDYIELCEIKDMSKLDEQAKIEAIRLISEELNILYVAATRAQKTLQLNSDLFAYLAVGE